MRLPNIRKALEDISVGVSIDERDAANYLLSEIIPLLEKAQAGCGTGSEFYGQLVDYFSSNDEDDD